jgi:hypothetical protein
VRAVRARWGHQLTFEARLQTEPVSEGNVGRVNVRNGKTSRGLPQRVALQLLLGAYGMACSTALEVPNRTAQEDADAAGANAEPTAPPPSLDAGAPRGPGAGFADAGFGGGGFGPSMFGETGVAFPWPRSDGGARPCEDDDGLPADLERDAGLDPCVRDSDGDGCDDAAELLLGGCSDGRRSVVVRPSCFEQDSAVIVRFTAPARDAGSWASLTLVAEPARGVRIEALVAEPSPPLPSGAGFRDVPAGTWLLFDVMIDDSFGRTSPVQLLLMSDDGRVVDRGKIAFLAQECPIVI